jgi:hypothetical protein
VRPAPASALCPVAPSDILPRRRQPAIVPCEWRHETKIPDAVPAIIIAHTFDRDQLLLAKVRHNRLLDLALGLLSYSLGTIRGVDVPSTGPVDVDELYVGLRDFGSPCIVPLLVQRPDHPIDGACLERVEAFCHHHYRGLTPRFVAVQLKPTDYGEVVVVFDLVRRDDRVRLRAEKHYRLVPADQISDEDLKRMANSTS